MASLLKKGSEGAEVGALQGLLNQTRWPVGAVTGQFDATTESSVRVMQRYAGLQIDGIVGPNTRKALAAAVLERSPIEPAAADEELKDADDFSQFLRKLSLRVARAGAAAQARAVAQITEATAIASRAAQMGEEAFRMTLWEVLRAPAAKTAETQSVTLAQAKAAFDGASTPEAIDALKALALRGQRFGAAGRSAEVHQAALAFLEQFGLTQSVLASLAAAPQTVSFTAVGEAADSRMGVYFSGADGAITEVGGVRSSDPGTPPGLLVGVTSGPASRLSTATAGAAIAPGNLGGAYWKYDWASAVAAISERKAPALPDIAVDFLGHFLGRTAPAGAVLLQPSAETLKWWP